MKRFSALSAAMISGLLASASHAAAPTITGFSPTSGGFGTNIVVTGTNLTGATATIGGVAAPVSSVTATQFTASLHGSPSGKIVVTTSGGTATSTGTFTVTPGIGLGIATSAHPQATFTVSAGGFDKYSSVDIYLDTTDLVLATTNANGYLTASVTVPATTTPGTHWITVDERANHMATQSSFSVNTDWLQGEFGPDARGLNPYEGTLGTANVAQLDTFWVAYDGYYGNATPLVESNGVIFAGDYSGTIRAYSNAGKLVWTATTGSGLDYKQPVIVNGIIYFGGGTTVSAFKVACGANGATCKPVWKATIPVSISSGLTYYNGMIYAPGSDGQIYPVDPIKGTVGTPIYAYENTDGGVSSPIAFSTGGYYYYAASTNFHWSTSGAQGVIFNNYGSSAAAVSGSNAYYTTGDGYVHQVNGWSSATSGTYCYPQPAVGNNGYVYAGGCTTLAAYSTVNGALRWQVTTNYRVQGITFANGVVYACIGYHVQAFDGSYGAALWTGAPCSGAPIVANAQIFANEGYIEADALPNVISSAAAARLSSTKTTATTAAQATAPKLSSLHPNYSLKAVRTPD